MQQNGIVLSDLDLAFIFGALAIVGVCLYLLWPRGEEVLPSPPSALQRAHRAGERVVALFSDYAQLTARIAAIHAMIERQGQFMPPELKAEFTAEVAAAYARLKRIHELANEEVAHLVRAPHEDLKVSLDRFVQEQMQEQGGA